MSVPSDTTEAAMIEFIDNEILVSADEFEDEFEDEFDSEHGVELSFFRCNECLREWGFVGDDKKPAFCPCCGAAHDFHPPLARKKAVEALKGLGE
jgi:rubrerythrin